MEYKFDLAGIGECLVELTERERSTYVLDFAGDVLNSLSFAGRLGLRTSLVSAIGDDLFTGELLDLLRTEGIDLQACPQVKDRANGVYFVRCDAAGRTQFSFARRGSAATETLFVQPAASIQSVLDSSRAVLVSSIPFATMRESDRLFQLLQPRPNHSIFFDANMRPALWQEPKSANDLLARMAKRANVLLLTNDDDHFLFGGARAARAAIEQHLAHGWKRVIYRQGAQPTVVSWDGESFAVPTSELVNPVDTTGAGDAFNAALIAGLARGNTVRDAVIFANAVAGHSTEFRGGRAKEISFSRLASIEQAIAKKIEETQGQLERGAAA